jgi:lipid II:glycine glycyltransferase (peptidoglycan interpeptide bridge formation enzyme)
MIVSLIDINWNPDFSIFASNRFLDSVGNTYGWIGGYGNGGVLRLVLPFTIVQRIFLKMARFRIEPIKIDKTITFEEEKKFLTEVIKILEKLGADMIIPATTNSIFTTYPEGAIAAPYGTYIINLNQEKNDIFKKFNASHRRNIRKAEKNGVEIYQGMSYADSAYNIIRDTFNRSQMSCMSQKSFSKYIDGLGQNVKIYIAIYKNVIQGCLVVPFSKHSAYYVYGGSIQHPAKGAINLLHWEAIKEFRKLGVMNYDFVGVRIDPEEGTKQYGLRTFKERFGGELKQGYIWKYSINPWKYFVYSLLVKIIRGGDIVDKESHKLENYNKISHVM